MPDLSSDIASQVLEPISSTADGQSATGRSVEELIRADQYLALKTAIGYRRRGLYITKLATQGAMGNTCSNTFDRPGCGGC